MRKVKGFTLVELMVVVAIIVVLAAALAPAIASANTKAKVGRASADLKVIASAIQLYKVDTGRWIGTNGANPSYAVSVISLTDGNNNPTTGPAPTTCPAQLLSNIAGAAVPAWDGPYIAELKLDPWGSPYYIGYQYTSSNQNLGQTTLAIWSIGPDMTYNSGRPPPPGTAGYPTGYDIQIPITSDTTR